MGSVDSDADSKIALLIEKYMFPQRKVMLSSRLGKGVFGTVFKGYAHKILSHENDSLVAIKVFKGNPEYTTNETQKVCLPYIPNIRRVLF